MKPILLAFPIATLAGALALLAADSPKPNTLTDEEKAAGWQLLFNGKDLTGWHNFKSEGVRPGWQIQDGVLVCADARNAGDIVTTGKYDWFDLQFDYNISEAGNSGLMFHVTDAGATTWATGPEFQLEDNKEAADPIRCGWLYALYQPPVDPKTDKPLDATKPVGEWNHVRLVLTPRNASTTSTGSSTSSTCSAARTSPTASPRASSGRCRNLPSPTLVTSPCKATTAKYRSATSSCSRSRRRNSEPFITNRFR